MLEVFKEIEFDAGHRVPNHKSKCRNPHGHRYKVRVGITGQIVTTPGASNEGMLADFGDLKSLMMEKVHDVLDHGFIIYEGDRVMQRMFWHDADPTRIDPEEGFKVIRFPYIPTAENMARWCWDQLVFGVLKMGFHLSYVAVWETPTSIATYIKDGSIVSPE
jgi:6-pyruvoyltetrahydropterin/6-carboxytetrahydropterin synthase